MASTIKVNNIQNQCGANIANKCGSTVTLGASGDTITLACGASQTGFGRTGTVDWDTTAKTASFTAVSGNGYFVNTTSGAVTATLPASPSAGDIVGFNDYARTFATNNLTVARNGSNIQGLATDATISTNGQSTMFVYVDGTQGWLPTEDQTTGNYGALYVTATGGTVTCCGDYRIHTFTGPGTFCVSCAGNDSGSNTVDYMVVAGGAGGGNGAGGSTDGGGGGGAGGYRESSGSASGCYTTSPLGACVSALPVSTSPYPITVGGGGGTDTNGSNSIFSTITSNGGGKGGSGSSVQTTGSAGGSGGGGNTNPGGGASGNTPPVSPPQGNNGGQGNDNYSGGGGGATAVGGNGGNPACGTPGTGATSSINGTPTTRAAGGSGNTTTAPSGTPQAANSGNGGPGGGSPNRDGGSGGSGIVIIRYKYQ
jgi:hypothetical protein